MNKKIKIGIATIVVLGIIAPVASFAAITDIACQGLPPNPTQADINTLTLSCLQKRVDNIVSQLTMLESRISALESRAVNYPTTQIPPAYPATNIGGSAPISGGGSTINVGGQTNTTGGQIQTNIGGQSQTSVGGSIQVTPTTQAVPTIQATPIIQQGASSDSVKAVQTFLQSAGTFSATPTGYFGDITKKAVLQFQANQGIPATGAVDSTTLNKMKALAPQVAPTMNATIQSIVVPAK